MTARYARGILAVAGLYTVSFLHAQTPLQIVTDSLPPASVGAPYSQQIVTSGGSCSTIGSASCKLDGGALPPRISVNSSATTKKWSLQGTPSAGGNFTFTLHLIWTHTRQTPFEQQCVDEAVKTLTLTVQANQTLTADRTQVTATWHTNQV